MKYETKKILKWFIIINIANAIIAAIIGQIQTEYLIKKINKNTNLPFISTPIKGKGAFISLRR